MERDKNGLWTTKTNSTLMNRLRMAMSASSTRSVLSLSSCAIAAPSVGNCGALLGSGQATAAMLVSPKRFPSDWELNCWNGSEKEHAPLASALVGPHVLALAANVQRLSRDKFWRMSPHK